MWDNLNYIVRPFLFPSPSKRGGGRVERKRKRKMGNPGGESKIQRGEVTRLKGELVERTRFKCSIGDKRLF